MHHVPLGASGTVGTKRVQGALPAGTVGFPVTIATLIGQTQNSNGVSVTGNPSRVSSIVSPTVTRDSKLDLVSTSSGSRSNRRVADLSPSPPSHVLPKARLTYGKPSNETRNRSSTSGAALTPPTTFPSSTPKPSGSNYRVAGQPNGTSTQSAVPSTLTTINFQFSPPLLSANTADVGAADRYCHSTPSVTSPAASSSSSAASIGDPLNGLGDPLNDLGDPLNGLGDSSNDVEPANANETRGKKKRNPVPIHEHISIVSGDPLLYQCNVCMKKFKTKAHIKYHEFCRNGEKPFKCNECGQGFIAKSHFEYHIRTHTG